VSGLPLLLAAALHLAGDGQTAPGPTDALQTARVQSMVASAQRFLLAHQNADGSFSVVRNDASKAAPVAVTSLAALSLMASGHLPDRGPHAQAVQRAIDWLVQHEQDGYVTTDGDLVSRMHGEGYAILAMTQAYGMQAGDAEHRDALRAAITRGVDLIERSQGDLHGWFYQPYKVDEHEGSVTVCMIQALRAARDIGFTVHKSVIDRALDYMKASQDPESGRFRYRINEPKMSWSLTAAALATLNSAGDYSSDMLRQGFDALQRWDPYIGSPDKTEVWIEYGSFYAAQAYWQAADSRPFARWWPKYLQSCEDEQSSDGAWNGGEFGNVYGTAIVSLSLQVPLGYLPIFQR
jgi:hypothetical protein